MYKIDTIQGKGQFLVYGSHSVDKNTTNFGFWVNAQADLFRNYDELLPFVG